MTKSGTAAFLPSSALPLATTGSATGRLSLGTAAPTSSHISFLVPAHRSPFIHAASLSSSSASSATSTWMATSTTTMSPTLLSNTVQHQQQSQQHFDAILPDPHVLIGMSIVVVISIVAAIVWNTQVVPVSRTKLAISKAKGPVKEYLDELRAAAPTTTTSIATTTTITTDRTAGGAEPDEMMTAAALDDNTNDTRSSSSSSSIQVNNNRSLERWLFADWLRSTDKSAPRTKKAPAVPLLPSAKWNSGDNPVLVTTAMMMVGIVVASITERASGVW